MIVSLIAVFGCFFCGACEKDETTIHTIRTVGTFSGYRVDFIRFEHKNAGVPAVIVEYCVGDVYIQTCPYSSYKYLVYKSEKDWLHLSDAYEQGLITHDDLLAIAKAEEPYDNLKRDDAEGFVR